MCRNELRINNVALAGIVMVVKLTAKDDETTLRKFAEFLQIRSARGNVISRLTNRAFAKYTMKLVFAVNRKGIISDDDNW